MDKKNLDPEARARDYAFLLLKFRLRSLQEISSRLKQKKFDQAVIEKTISFLKDKGFLDDHLFARSWIESRLKRPFGFTRLVQELKIKGIAPEIISSCIGEAKKDYPEDEIVLELARERFKKLRGIERQKSKQRIYGYLMRRGFSADAVVRAVREL